MGDRWTETDPEPTWWPVSDPDDDVARLHSGTQTWPACPGPGALIGVALGISLGTLAVFTFVFALTQTGPAFFVWGLFSVVLVVTAGVSLYLGMVATRMNYVLTEEELVINAGGLGWRVPFAQIQGVAYGTDKAPETSGWERFWPGLYLDRRSTSRGERRSAATAPGDQRVHVYCADGAVIEVSPWRPVQFVGALETNLARFRFDGQGGAAPYTPPISRVTSPREPLAERLDRRLTAFHLWRVALQRDKLVSNAVALSLTLIICMGLYTVYRVDGVNQPLPARWDAAGEVTFWLRPDGPWVASGLWFYALLGLYLLVTNVALSSFLLVIDRHLARYLVLATPALEVVVLIALLRATM